MIGRLQLGAGMGGAVLVLLAGGADARELTGALAYRERIALPPEASVIVEATDRLGRSLAVLARPTGGAQVPLPFTLEVPEGQEITLRGGIATGPEVRWLSAPVAVAAGAAAADLGTIPLTAHREIGLSSHLRCGDVPVAAGFGAGGAGMRVGPLVRRLVQVEVASGAKYADPADPETWLWSKGDAATVSLGGTVLPDCTPALPPGSGWRAIGHEPDWSAELAGGQLRFTPFGGDPREAALPAPEASDAGALYRLDAIGLALTVAPGPCADTMTGMPYPDRVTLADGSRSLAGCGGDPLVLIAGPEWRVTELAGGALPEGAGATLQLFPGGTMAGRAACNRFTGRFTLSGEGLRLEPAGMTQMACAEPVMAAERAMLDALGSVDRFDVGPDGELRLLGGDRVLFRARF